MPFPSDPSRFDQFILEQLVLWLSGKPSESEETGRDPIPPQFLLNQIRFTGDFLTGERCSENQSDSLR